MTLTAENVSAFVELFGSLKIDPSATRSAHMQASGFVWSDEKPDSSTPGEYPVAINTFMVYLISYRSTIIRGSPFEPFTPIWNRFQELCPSWPGFSPERSNPDAVTELDAELDEQLNYLERYLSVCERRRARCRDTNQDSE